MKRLIIVLVLIALGVGIYVLISVGTTSSINSFEACEKAGYPIMESYPRQCQVPYGQTFTETITPTEGTGLANPASTNCIENGGTLVEQTDNAGVLDCVFDDGTRCEEWAYFRGECGQGK